MRISDWSSDVCSSDLYITHLNGELIYGGTLDDAVERMRGAPGTSIKLTIFRPGREQAFDVGITREIIELKPVRWEVTDGIGVINPVSFSGATGADVTAAIRGMEKSLRHTPLGEILELSSKQTGR